MAENQDQDAGSSLPQNPSGNIQNITIESEMRQSYLDYAMSVIVGRALPDVRMGSSRYTGAFCSP